MGNYLSLIGTKVDHNLENKRPLVIVSGTVLGCLTFHMIYKVVYYFATHEDGAIIPAILEILLPLIEKSPLLSKGLDQEVLKIKRELWKSYNFDAGRLEPQFEKLPEDGLKFDPLVTFLQKMKKENPLTRQKISGAIYVGDSNHTKLTDVAYTLFGHVNPLHVDMYPSIWRMEREIIRMACNLLHGDKYCVGLLSSGGTESIILSVKAARDFCKKKRPNIVVCETAHPAFDKACHYLGIEIKKVKAEKSTQKLDVKLMEKSITKDTILLVASAPSYPCGIIDPVEEVAALGEKYSILVHVDSCLGGWYLPFAQRLDLGIPPFDFALKGVTSISADTHKFGLAPKGTSCLVFRSAEVRKCAFYACGKWGGGAYATSGITGSRPGGLIAGTWASLVHKGMNGYKKVTMQIHRTVRTIVEGVKEINGVFVLGKPQSMIVAIGGERIYQVMDSLSKKGWKLNGLNHPIGFHFCITMKNIGIGEVFLKDLRLSVEEVRKDPTIYEKGSTSIYGMTKMVPANFVDGLTVNVLEMALDGRY